MAIFVNIDPMAGVLVLLAVALVIWAVLAPESLVGAYELTATGLSRTFDAVFGLPSEVLG